MAIKWQERFSLKNEKIDTQHKELFSLVNRVDQLSEITTTKEEISTIFKEFFTYMKEHFGEEEVYMESIGYPQLEHHKRLHQQIINEFTTILKEKKTVYALQESIKIVARKWLVEHILEDDQKIEHWRKNLFVPVKETQAFA